MLILQIILSLLDIRICCILKVVGIDKILKKESYIINKEDLYADIQNGRQKRW